MSKFKLQGLGLDLRNPIHEISPVSIEKLTPEDRDVKVDYAMIDLLDPFPHRSVDILQQITVNGGVLVVYIDLKKFSSGLDPFSESLELFEAWKDGEWGIMSTSTTILFENLPEGEWEGIKEWKEKKDITYIGLTISTVDKEKVLGELQRWESLWGKKPEVIARPISPLHYSVDLEEWIKLGEPVTLGLDILGGKMGQATLEEIFGIQYLLAFASYHSQAVLLSNPGVETRGQLEWMRALIGKELEGKTGEKFDVTKSISKIPKTPKKLIYESFELPLGENSWTIPVGFSDILYSYSDTKFSFTAPKVNISSLPEFSEDWNLSGIEFDAKERLFHEVDPRVKSSEVSWKAGIIAISNFLSDEFKISDRWVLEYCALGEYALAINAYRLRKKNWLRKYFPDEVESQRSFLLVMKNPGHFYFIDIESLEKTLISQKPEKED